MVAAEEGSVENVKILLAAGADVSRKDNDGDTALKYAQEKGSDEVIASLMAYGAFEEER